MAGNIYNNHRILLITNSPNLFLQTMLGILANVTSCTASTTDTLSSVRSMTTLPNKNTNFTWIICVNMQINLQAETIGIFLKTWSQSEEAQHASLVIEMYQMPHETWMATARRYAATLAPLSLDIVRVNGIDVSIPVWTRADLRLAASQMGSLRRGLEHAGNQVFTSAEIQVQQALALRESYLRTEAKSKHDVDNAWVEERLINGLDRLFATVRANTDGLNGYDG
jgi:hypothetical protein